MLATRPRRLTRKIAPALCVVPLLAMVGCKSGPTAEVTTWTPEDPVKIVFPSNDRDWAPDQARLATALFVDNEVTVRNIRNCNYRSEDDYEIDYYDKTFDLNKLNRVDFIVVPFLGSRSIAHTMLSFGFDDEDYLVVSVEIRKERNEKYTPLGGMMRQYEIMYVVGDERDLVKLRAIHRLTDVYLYRGRATPQQVQALFRDVMQRVNKLAVEPEFYDTISNNCTSSIAQHINRVVPNRVPIGLETLFTGYSDRLAYDLGLLETNGTFEQTKRQARINELAYLYRDSPDFSRKIRR